VDKDANRPILVGRVRQRQKLFLVERASFGNNHVRRRVGSTDRPFDLRRAVRGRDCDRERFEGRICVTAGRVSVAVPRPVRRSKDGKLTAGCRVDRDRIENRGRRPVGTGNELSGHDRDNRNRDPSPRQYGILHRNQRLSKGEWCRLMPRNVAELNWLKSTPNSPAPPGQSTGTRVHHSSGEIRGRPGFAGPGRCCHGPGSGLCYTRRIHGRIRLLEPVSQRFSRSAFRNCRR